MAELKSGAPELRGLVLAGGRSVRMGRDKASIPVGGLPLLDRAVSLLTALKIPTQVAVRADQLSDESRRRFTLIPDAYDGIGPAAGILSAHRTLPQAAWLVLACDMPWVTDELLRMLIERRDPARAATAFRTVRDGAPEPLCAIYEPATLARFRRQVEAGGNPSTRDWLAAVDPLLLDAPAPGVLDSVNTPEELNRLPKA